MDRGTLKSKGMKTKNLLNRDFQLTSYITIQSVKKTRRETILM